MTDIKLNVRPVADIQIEVNGEFREIPLEHYEGEFDPSSGILTVNPSIVSESCYARFEQIVKEGIKNDSN